MQRSQWRDVSRTPREDRRYSEVLRGVFPRISMRITAHVGLLLIFCVCPASLAPGKQAWPAGSYGLPRSIVGCPTGKGVTFQEGGRFQDLENNNNANNWSKDEFHLSGEVGIDIKLEFCMKTEQQTGFGKWPPGQYCIFKRGDCPQDFFSGWVSWHDETDNNKNFKWGELPDGIYDSNTKIEFCCRSDGPLQKKIKLPTDKPFFLLRFSTGCQKVAKTLVLEEWLQWDMDDTKPFQFEHSSLHPYIEPPNHDASTIRLHFCFYFRPSQMKMIMQAQKKKNMLLLNKTKF